MELRKLMALDIGVMCDILKGIGLKEFQPIFKGVEIKKGMTMEQIGYAVMFDLGAILLENLPKVQKDMDKFLASLSNNDVETIQHLGLGEYAELIYQLVTKDDFKDFFNVVMKLFNQ